MIRVSDETKNAYKIDSSHKVIEIRIPSASLVLTNEDVIADSLELKESIESGDNLSFQGCISASFKFECFNLVDETLEGEWIECDITADNTTTIPLFRGYISEVTNATHEEFTTVIRAYDALYSINQKDVTEWYNGLTFPITVINMRNSFFNYVGVTQVADYLPNDSLAVQKTIEDKVIKGETIIKAICQINGRFGRISRNGLFEYVHLVEATEALYPREDLYPDDDVYPADENAIDRVARAHYSEISFENYRVQAISKVQIISKDGSIGASSGSGTNIFTLNNNPLVWGLSSANMQSVATNLLNTIIGLWYVPSKIKCVGLPYVECGDFVLMIARRSLVRAYVLNRTLKGIQILVDNYTAEGQKTQPTYTPTIQNQTNANAHAITTESTRAVTAELAEATTRQTQITNEANTRQSQINAVNVRCDKLVAKDAQIENLVATKATISDLNATNGRIDNLSSKVANIDSLVATKASISDLNAANARINNLSASKANVSDLNATNARIDQLASNRVTTDYLRAHVVSIYGVSCTKLTLAGNDLGLSTITTGSGRSVRVVVAH